MYENGLEGSRGGGGGREGGCISLIRTTLEKEGGGGLEREGMERKERRWKGGDG